MTQMHEQDYMACQLNGDHGMEVLVDEQVLTQTVVIKDADEYAQEQDAAFEMEYEEGDLELEPDEQMFEDAEADDDAAFWNDEFEGDDAVVIPAVPIDPNPDPISLVEPDEVQPEPSKRWKGKERMVDPVERDVADIESLFESKAPHERHSSGDFSFGSDIDPDLLRNQMDALESFHNQKESLAREVEAIRDRYDPEGMIFEVESQMKTRKGGPSGLKNRIDQVDGPPGSPPRHSAKRKSRKDQVEIEDIEDSDDDGKQQPVRKK
ncbi:hypothetical protein HDU99_009914, partial [Rhizoclosmatium hyalinum]